MKIDIKNKRINKTKQKQTQRYREQAGGHQSRGSMGEWVKEAKGIKKYKLPVVLIK